MRLQRARWSLLLVVCIGALGCGPMPGRPKPGPEVPRPESVMDFKVLYAENCAACHGENGLNGPSYPLGNPEYQALVDDATLRDWVANGRPGTMMPGFGPASGGALSDAQVDVLVRGMRAAWSKPGVLEGQHPPYHAAGAGSAPRGAQVYGTYCASCHGAPSASPGGDPAGDARRAGLSDTASGKSNTGSSNTGSSKAGSITDPAFLALVSDQNLRSTVIAGRPDLGQPDWRGDVAGHPMSDQDVTDIVSWLASQRPDIRTGLAANSPVEGQNPGSALRGNPSMEGQNGNNTRRTLPGGAGQPAQKPPAKE